ncbi:zinc-binding protein A33-like [Hemitrygon akajei]|uniref:zinc-binding protein A33-like n=1 Tax=Hemitrygon akajei TaxID=2704970 RepID=UPI003BF99DF9
MPGDHSHSALRRDYCRGDETDQLKSSLDSHTKKKSDFQEKEQQQKEKISGVREQSHSVQSHITSQFAELRQIITEKEQSLLRDLREEEKRILNPMEKNLQEIQENIRFIQEEILKLKEQMDQKDGVIFLKEEARRNRRINDDIQELSVTDEALPVGKFVHPYLLNTVLREKLDTIKRVSVTLDVETASPCLEVSEDRKSVRRTWTWRNLPDTGKRFTKRACVLGSEGFTSGRHYWEVEVTGNRVWCLGVAAESVERKRRPEQPSSLSNQRSINNALRAPQAGVRDVTTLWDRVVTAVRVRYPTLLEWDLHGSGLQYNTRENGYIFDSGQVTADPEKILAVAEWPKPTDRKQL